MLLQVLFALIQRVPGFQAHFAGNLLLVTSLNGLLSGHEETFVRETHPEIAAALDQFLTDRHMKGIFFPGKVALISNLCFNLHQSTLLRWELLWDSLPFVLR